MNRIEWEGYGERCVVERTKHDFRVWFTPNWESHNCSVPSQIYDVMCNVLNVMVMWRNEGRWGGLAYREHLDMPLQMQEDDKGRVTYMITVTEHEVSEAITAALVMNQGTANG